MSTLPASLTALRQQLLEAPANTAARQIVEAYFQFIKPAEFQQELWVLTVSLLTNNDMQQAATGQDRQDIIFFFEFTTMFVEAVHFLYHQHTNQQQVQAGGAGSTALP